MRRFFQNHKSRRILVLLLLCVTLALYLITSTQMGYIFRARTIQYHHAVEKEEVILIHITKDIKNINKSAIGPSTRKNVLTIKMHQLNNSQIYQLAERESNLPLTYWERWKDFSSNQIKISVTYCPQVALTDPFNVEFNNRFWQIFTTLDTLPNKKSITMYMLNAYYDKRIFESPVVKLLSVNNQEHLSRERDWWCLLWFDKTKAPILVKANDYYTLWDIHFDPKLQPNIYYPQLITCPIPKEYQNEVPQAVSLQSNGDCNRVEQKPSNTLRVIYNKKEAHIQKPKKSRIGVCVKAFRFNTYDISVRLVEWLEMMRLMGAERVHLYVYSSNDNLAKVLKTYQDEDFVDWRPMALPGMQLNIPALYQLLADTMASRHWPQELIELNDCLYQNLYRYDYIAILDIDEVIMPQRVTDWHQLINLIESRLSSSDKSRIAYYSGRHSHVCQALEEKIYQNKSIPEYLYMSRHTHRAPPLHHENQKSIVRTDLVTAVHNHFPLRCNYSTDLYSGCDQVLMNPTDALLLHYRKNQTHPMYAFQNNACKIRDRSNWRFYHTMAKNVREKLDQIFVLN